MGRKVQVCLTCLESREFRGKTVWRARYVLFTLLTSPLTRKVKWIANSPFFTHSRIPTPITTIMYVHVPNRRRGIREKLSSIGKSCRLHLPSSFYITSMSHIYPATLAGAHTVENSYRSPTPSLPSLWYVPDVAQGRA